MSRTADTSFKPSRAHASRTSRICPAIGECFRSSFARRVWGVNTTDLLDMLHDHYNDACADMELVANDGVIFRVSNDWMKKTRRVDSCCLVSRAGIGRTVAEKRTRASVRFEADCSTVLSSRM